MMAGKKRSLLAIDSDIRALHKEWDDSPCPVCMEHPHNAVLLLCSSQGKGCRPYICDTSYRHSNCLDRYRKLKMEPEDNASHIGGTNQHSSSGASSNTRPGHSNGTVADTNLNDIQRVDVNLRMDRDGHDTRIPERTKLKMKCPLCRGEVQGWEVVKEAREYLNLKTRSCTRESCSFVGNYSELRRHARSIHPSARPSEIDPRRQRAWRHFVHQREYDDVVSAIHSAIPGAVVMGDFVIENGNDAHSTAFERGRGGSNDLSGPLLTTLFLFQMLGSAGSAGDTRNRSRGSWSRHRRFSPSWSRRRYLWGENLLGLQEDEDGYGEGEDDHLSAVNLDDDHNDSHVPRRRRRLNRPRSNGGQTS